VKLYRNVTLEMSLKPFKRADEAYCRSVLRRIFSQWSHLLIHAEQVSVLLWTADGSEILEYTGDLDSSLEWACYVGGANPIPGIARDDPEGLGLHSRSYLYTEHPPAFTLNWLRSLVSWIKQEGRSTTGLPVRVGETFDPGPEFAVSRFKYERHPEICMSRALWAGRFVTCYSRLAKDDRPYASFPDGVPDGTPFGTFLGRQSERFCSDIGFDYLWLSNGFGFGMDTWNAAGAIFDGRSFDPGGARDVYSSIFNFWNSFRAEFSLPVETRGTNMSTGMDLSSDAVPLRDIYAGKFGIEVPPNSPWAAIDGDFGLELSGWMSHIAVLPGTSFPFRLYTHDPWWMNSPWIDRYEGLPHDIYLPSAVSRLDSDGKVSTPDSLLLLTVDDSHGDLPERVPNEVVPELLRCRASAPDEPGPFLWVYPFDEYHHRLDRAADGDLQCVFFGDWFIRGAINRGAPINTVVSTAAFADLLRTDRSRLAGSVAIIPTAVEDPSFYDLLLSWMEEGGRVLLYGSATSLPPPILSLLGIQLSEPEEGEFEVLVQGPGDEFEHGALPSTIRHEPLVSDEGLRERFHPGVGEIKALVELRRGAERLPFAVSRGAIGPGGGTCVWIRGGNSFELPIKTSLPSRADPHRLADPSRYLRYVLDQFGYDIRFSSYGPEKMEPVLTCHRSAGAFFLSGYVPNTTTELRLRFPWGAPVLSSMDTRLRAGRSCYRFGRAFRSEIRIFVSGQDDGILSCAEIAPIMVGVNRRLLVRHLRDATIRFFFEEGAGERTTYYLSSYETQYDVAFPGIASKVREPRLDRSWGIDHHVLESLTGDLLISW